MPLPFPDDSSSPGTWDGPGPDLEDLRLAALVAQRLSVDWSTRRQQITVEVQNRVVILAGLVSTGRARQVAGELAWDVPGVFDVCNTIHSGDQRRARR